MKLESKYKTIHPRKCVEKNAFENVVFKMVVILYRHQCVDKVYKATRPLCKHASKMLHRQILNILRPRRN